MKSWPRAIFLVLLMSAFAFAASSYQYARKRLAGSFAVQQFGFSVTIPPTVVAYGPYCSASGICGTTHGFWGSLEHDSEAEISLFARADGSVRSNEEAEKLILSTGHPQGVDPVVVSRVGMRLDRLPAVRVVSRFGSTLVDTVFAVRNVSKGNTVVYQIVLRGRGAHYTEDKPAMDALVRSFRVRSIPGV